MWFPYHVANDDDDDDGGGYDDDDDSGDDDDDDDNDDDDDEDDDDNIDNDNDMTFTCIFVYRGSPDIISCAAKTPDLLV